MNFSSYLSRRNNLPLKLCHDTYLVATSICQWNGKIAVAQSAIGQRADQTGIQEVGLAQK